MIKEYSDMKKKYIKPVSDIVIINHTTGILSNSYVGADPDDQLAPPMMNMPEEDIPTEYED